MLSLSLGYLSNNQSEKVLELFEEIPMEVNEVIIAIFFNACAKLSNVHSIQFGKDVLNRLPKPFLQHQALNTSAINMLMKFGQVKDAERLFEQVMNKTIVNYGSMMQSISTKISLYEKDFLFSLDYVNNNLFEEALNFFEEIPFERNEVLYIIISKACASLCNERAMALGKKILEQMPKEFLNHIVLVNSIINMLMKFGQVNDAERLFKQVKNKTIVTYGTMMQGRISNQLILDVISFLLKVM
jgi:pentatricopeptide repeat protein